MTMSLVDIYEEFRGHSCVAYFPEFQWELQELCGEEGKQHDAVWLSFDRGEALAVRKDSKPRELVVFGSLPKKGQMIVCWHGESAKGMQTTADSLRLPNRYDFQMNLFERVFYQFRADLSMVRDGSPLRLTRRVVAGYERHLRFFLAKLLWVYDGNVVDSRFYENWKNRRTRKRRVRQ